MYRTMFIAGAGMKSKLGNYPNMDMLIKQCFDWLSYITSLIPCNELQDVGVVT